MDRAIAALARRQHGVIATRQLSRLGVSRDAIYGRVQANRLHRIHRGVYAVGHDAVSPLGRDLAAVLSCGPGAVLSHLPAGALWGFVRYALTRREVTAPRSRRGPAEVVVHRSRQLDDRDRAAVDAVPVTSVARTLVDLADVMTERRLADAVHETEVLRLFDLAKVMEAQARVPGRPGAGRLGRVLAGYGDGLPLTRSEAERRFLELCESHCLPQPRTNALVHGFEVDLYWPKHKLVVEVDGGASHDTRRAFVNDRRRDRALAREGIQVLRVAAVDLERGAADLAAILRR